MYRTLLLSSCLALALPLSAQSVRVVPGGSGEWAIASAGSDGNRAMIGVSTSSGSRRDTLGVLISSLSSGGPAEKAGLTEGDRIQSINGVSLRVSRDDAGDDEMGGIMQRRLTRELGKAKAGDEVTLQVWHDGASKSYKVKTVVADELNRPSASAIKRDERAVLGINFSITGSKRDTMGVFVTSVSEDGPAEKAGIMEGDRIAAINGVSLKMSKDDLEDSWVASSRLSRLSREVGKGKPGDVVELTVVSGGRARPVKVTLAKASSLKEGGSSGFMFLRSPEAPMAPMAPMPPMSGMTFTVPTPPSAPHAPSIQYRSFDGDAAVIQLQMDGVRKTIEQTLRSELPKARIEMQRSMESARKQLQDMRVTYSRTRTVRM